MQSVTVGPVDEAEAEAVAADVLAQWRLVPFAELTRLVDESVWTDRMGASGTEYSVKVYGLWDSGSTAGDLRVVAAAMDGSKKTLGALRSVTANFIVTPDGRFLS